ncbi:hypothetical protein B0H11DRAFT_1974774 [Mycena galericulata]|nr:hypothetical protein B0H11DRAFT_1974774 [Mycena galericulata]
MHRCLAIPEIVNMFCTHLDPRISSDTFQIAWCCDLATVARTCTTFSGPALDHLWSSTSLRKLLIYCMPSDLWAIDAVPNYLERKKIRLLRTIRVSDWDRILFYAPRVKSLWSGHDGWSLSGIFPALCVSLPGALFPNLQTLNWEHSLEDFHYIHLFLHRTLTQIEFSIPTSDSASSLLSTLPAKCPKLADISLLSRGHIDSGAVSDLVRGLKFARRIKVPSLDQNALEHVSHLTTLTSLALSSLPTSLALSQLVDGQRFPVLRRLMLTFADIGPTTQFLRYCSRVPLETFHVSFYELNTAKEMDDIFSVISAGFLHSSLTDLSIDNQSDHDSDEVDPSIHLTPFHSLRRVFAFVNLTTVSIRSLLGFDLDNDAMAELARVWPRIVTLHLRAHFSGHIPRATLSCLQSFAQHCPHLRRLTVVVDATVIPTPDADPMTRFVQRTLRALGVEHSPMANPISVTRFLSGVFPKLSEVQTQREYDDNDDEDELAEHGDDIRLHNRWKEVQALLPVLSAVREEGRVLALGPSNA